MDYRQCELSHKARKYVSYADLLQEGFTRVGNHEIYIRHNDCGCCAEIVFDHRLSADEVIPMLDSLDSFDPGKAIAIHDGSGHQFCQVCKLVRRLCRVVK